ncbi:hypothetical protein ACFQ07_01315 [Actinomadura adrarensis]|uniref:Uncharacterized protein n=1 Tax=Actinomadura adrarensis TaxID=1819600 RepID=A0ABW3C8S2_9ACTN
MRHPGTDRATVQTLAPTSPALTSAVKDRAARLPGLPPDHIVISAHGHGPLLHSAKLTRQPAGPTPRER